MEKDLTDVRTRQAPSFKLYRSKPEDALITDHAVTVSEQLEDPVHGRVKPGSQDYGDTWTYGIHQAVGGMHDAPNPGDMLAAALAACLDSTIRMIANRMGITLKFLQVEVSSDVDVKGTLVIDPNIPVGFNKMRTNVRIKPAGNISQEKIHQLLKASEYSCVNLQTLRNGVEVETSLEISQA